MCFLLFFLLLLAAASTFSPTTLALGSSASAVVAVTGSILVPTSVRSVRLERVQSAAASTLCTPGAGGLAGSVLVTTASSGASGSLAFSADMTQLTVTLPPASALSVAGVYLVCVEYAALAPLSFARVNAAAALFVGVCV